MMARCMKILQLKSNIEWISEKAGIAFTQTPAFVFVRLGMG